MPLPKSDAGQIAALLIDHNEKNPDVPLSEYIVSCFVAAGILADQLSYKDHAKVTAKGKEILDHFLKARQQ